MFNTQTELLENIAGRYPNNAVVVMMYTPKLGYVYIFVDEDEESEDIEDTFVIYKDNDNWCINETDKGKASAILHLESIKLLSEAIQFEDDDIFNNGLD